MEFVHTNRRYFTDALLLLIIIPLTLQQQFLKLEAEDYSGKSFSYRQAASQAKTAALKNSDMIEMPFCLRNPTAVSVHKVFYTNDGLPNTVSMFIDMTLIGAWISHNRTDRGTHWNKVYEVGPIGNTLIFSPGSHKLKLRVMPGTFSFGHTDKYGIEIDAVYLKIWDNEVTKSFLRCYNTECYDSITYSDRHKDRSDIPSGRIVQMSEPTQCLEMDNIKIPIYHDTVKQFRISALPPRYRTFWTNKDAQFEGCPEYSEYHWQYIAVDCTNIKHKRTHRLSQLTYSDAMTDDSCKITISFNLEGMYLGKTDAHIGSILEIGIDGNDDDDDDDNNDHVTIKPIYGVKGAYDGIGCNNELESKDINKNKRIVNWNIPDLTWAQMISTSDTYSNNISIQIHQNARLGFIRLRRRHENMPKMTKLFQSRSIIVEKSEFDFWWRDPAIHSGLESDMEVYVSTRAGEMFKGTADYIVMIDRRVWSPYGGSDHTFVLYQDGSARILPVGPHGLETYVPFGSSVIIGQSDPTYARPHAPIKKLVIKPEEEALDVYYQDGGYAKIYIESSIRETNITVTNVNFSKDKLKHPFAVFRSTWVEDGRAKVDHVTVNGLPAEHILRKKWQTRYGTNFIFFRKCISSYNTQSPDYSVEILSDTEVR